MEIRVKHKQNKNDIQLSFVKIGGFSLNFWNRYTLYLKLLTSKMYEIQPIIAGSKTGIKAKSTPAVCNYFRI